MTTYRKLQHEWIFKASWRATAVKMVVLARTYEEAEEKAARIVKRMEGGQDCMDLTYVGMREDKDGQ